MCPGVGKTCAMLQTAGREQLDGVDVAVGMIETHGQNAVAALLEGLSVISLRKINSRGITREEMDLDAVLDRRPMLVLVDELAHTNAPGSRHPRRYQDVLELLDAGISVYTTLDIGHIESRVDVVRQITGTTVKETVPDCVLDRADEIQLIDVPPQELRRRLDERKVCVDEMGAAAKNLFEVEHLAALREMALRFVAERADRDVRGTMLERKIAVPWKAEERMIVAVGPDSHADRLIRWTRRIAGKLSERLTALIIDDEVQIRRLLRIVLEAEDYRVLEAETGQQGLSQIALRRPNVILLDLGLPDLDGLTLLRRLREWSRVPVLILSVRDEPEEKVAALDKGTDDYVTKPFDSAELLARLRAIQRRAPHIRDDPFFQTGHVTIDFATHTVTVQGHEVKLTATEYALLGVLAHHAGKVVTHKMLLREVWGPNAENQSQYLRVYMTHLRKKIEIPDSQPKLLKTEPGIGYRLLIASP